MSHHNNSIGMSRHNSVESVEPSSSSTSSNSSSCSHLSESSSEEEDEDDLRSSLNQHVDPSKFLSRMTPKTVRQQPGGSFVMGDPKGQFLKVFKTRAKYFKGLCSIPEDRTTPSRIFLDAARARTGRSTWNNLDGHGHHDGEDEEEPVFHRSPVSFANGYRPAHPVSLGHQRDIVAEGVTFSGEDTTATLDMVLQTAAEKAAVQVTEMPSVITPPLQPDRPEKEKYHDEFWRRKTSCGSHITSNIIIINNNNNKDNIGILSSNSSTSMKTRNGASASNNHPIACYWWSLLSIISFMMRCFLLVLFLALVLLILVLTSHQEKG